jgi:hypothetical protein
LFDLLLWFVRLGVRARFQVSVVERVAASLAVAAALDRRAHASDVARKVQVEQLRAVVRESLHQARNPLTALRTFGKLLLRRLQLQADHAAKALPPSTAAAATGDARAVPGDPGAALNRELAADLLAQSDRLVALLLPMERAVTPQHRPLLLEPGDSDDADAGSGAGATQRAGAPATSSKAGAPAASALPTAAERAAVAGALAVRALPAPPVAADNGALLRSTSSGASGPSSTRSNSGRAGYPLGGLGADVRVCFVGDVLGPILRAAAAIADRDGTAFTLRCTPDSGSGRSGRAASSGSGDGAEVADPLAERRLGSHGEADVLLADALDELPGVLADERGFQVTARV